MVFRTLAKKSVLKFGRFAEWSVIQLISMNKHNYLIWVYYHCSHISFNDEILEILDITEDRQIKKPGTDSSYFDEHKNDFIPLYDEALSKRAYGKFERADNFAKKVSCENKQKTNLKRRQRVNQGHYTRNKF